MPTYEYRCPNCGDFELVQKITDEALRTCPTCGKAVSRLVSAAAFHLKGSGWYKTDYASSSASNSATHASNPSKAGEEKDAAPKSDDSKTPADAETAKGEAKSDSKAATESSSKASSS
ncbi:MAG: zinc ribbon domain-containing protein [Deltaproteobacteria bacterium]|nr:zinc ribbon domain-containing protein [Deltaproteobacteria bacterium]